jgi:hypothetical protein
VNRGAILSDGGHYRYSLWRIEDETRPLVLWIMLNPSTADASEDDATIRRCLRFTRDWGCGGLLVGNLFAFRATQPSDLLKQPDPAGEENDLYLRRMMARADWTVVAWGRGVPGMAHRILEVVTLAHDLEEPLLCLGTTHAGDPLHPLRLRADTQPRLWAADPRLTRAGFVLS